MPAGARSLTRVDFSQRTVIVRHASRRRHPRGLVLASARAPPETRPMKVVQGVLGESDAWSPSIRVARTPPVRAASLPVLPHSSRSRRRRREKQCPASRAGWRARTREVRSGAPLRHPRWGGLVLEMSESPCRGSRTARALAPAKEPELVTARWCLSLQQPRSSGESTRRGLGLGSLGSH